MGRELCKQLSREGCHVAFCDLSPPEMEETVAICEADAPAGTRITCHRCDVSAEASVLEFRDAVVQAHSASSVNYVFNNAGVAGGAPFLDESPDARERWERCFNIDVRALWRQFILYTFRTYYILKYRGTHVRARSCRGSRC